MANEFSHVTVGTDLTQSEYESVLGHAFNGQATGDIMYASSAVQLSRLAKGTQGYPLVMGASLPQWGGATLLNGALDAGGQAISNAVSIKSTWGGVVESLGQARLEANRMIFQSTAGIGAIESKRNNASQGVGIEIKSLSNVDGDVVRMAVSSGYAAANTDIAIQSCNLTFITSLDPGSVADTVSIGGYEEGAGARVLSIGQEDAVITEAIGASDRTLRARINGVTYKIMLHT